MRRKGPKTIRFGVRLGIPTWPSRTVVEAMVLAGGESDRHLSRAVRCALSWPCAFSLEDLRDVVCRCLYCVVHMFIICSSVYSPHIALHVYFVSPLLELSHTASAHPLRAPSLSRHNTIYTSIPHPCRKFIHTAITYPQKTLTKTSPFEPLFHRLLFMYKCRIWSACVSGSGLGG